MTADSASIPHAGCTTPDRRGGARGFPDSFSARRDGRAADAAKVET
jgi:hypothetical protein